MKKTVKPLQVYLDQSQRKQLEKISEALGEKTLSATIKRLIKIFYSLKINL